MSRTLRARELAAAFDAGAPVYDVLVDSNPGYHDHLRISAQRFHRHLGLENAGDSTDGAGLRLLDAGCGTGASTAALLSVLPRAEIVAVDAAAAMLDRARAKSWPDTVRFVHSPIEELAAAGVRGPFDGIFAAYLLRNLADPDGQLRAMREALVPGGTLAVHEYVAGRDRVARATWHAVCWGIVIPLAVVRRGGIGLYRHLWRSVATFDDAPRLRDRLRTNGFTDLSVEPMPGWQKGIEYTFLGRAPGSH